MVRLLHLMRAYGRVSADGLHQSPLPPGDTSSRLPYGCRLFQYITFALARRQPGRTNMHTNNAISLIQMALLYLLVLSVVGTFFFLFCKFRLQGGSVCIVLQGVFIKMFNISSLDQMQ